GRPMDEALEGGEAQDLAAGVLAGLQPDRSAEEVEHGEQDKHAEDGDAADPRQRAFMESAITSSLRLLHRRQDLVRNRETTLELAEFAQELLFRYRLSRRIRAARLLRRYRVDTCHEGEEERRHQEADC